MFTNASSLELKWLSENNQPQRIAWLRGGVSENDPWLVVQLLRSVGGGAGNFAAPSAIDPNSSSGVVQTWSVQPDGWTSRKK